MAEYGIESEDEEFTYDDLGNRDGSIDLRVGSETYVVDANNNRYDEVGGNSLSYNNAGDLTTDKNVYKYEYDYENRIVRIKDSADADVAEYAYDALGRRIEKVDSKTSANSRRYYHGKQWSRRAGKTDTSNNEKAWYIYGNYIDEVLRITDPSNYKYYYVHDHCTEQSEIPTPRDSPVALLDDAGDVVERYEYDPCANPVKNMTDNPPRILSSNTPLLAADFRVPNSEFQIPPPYSYRPPSFNQRPIIYDPYNPYTLTILTCPLLPTATSRDLASRPLPRTDNHH